MAFNTSDRSLRRTIDKYATILFAIIVLLLAIGVLYFTPIIGASYLSQDGAAKLNNVSLSVATSLIAAVIFAFLYGFIVEKYHVHIISDDIATTVREVVREIKEEHEASIRQITEEAHVKMVAMEGTFAHQISSTFAQLIPEDYFPPTTIPDPRFNNDLEKLLNTSKQYHFKGVTGRFVPTRVQKAGRHDIECRVLLVDPQRIDLLELYARDRFGTQSMVGNDIDDHVKVVQEEIYRTIIDLFELRKRTNISTALYEGPVFYRTEIFDQQVLVSYFTSRESTAFPMTYKYSAKSFYYDIYLTDFRQAESLSKKKISFSTNTTNEMLAIFLEDIGCSRDDLQRLRMEHQRKGKGQVIRPHS